MDRKAMLARLGWWKLGVAGLAIALPVYYALGTEASRGAAFSIINAIAAACVLIGIRLNRPPDATPWVVLVAGLTSLAVGNSAWFLEFLLKGDGQTIVGNLFFLTGYTATAIALLLFLRRRDPRVNLGNVVDGLIIVISVGMVSWMTLVDPFLDMNRLTELSYAGNLASPIGDLFLFAALVGLVVGSGPRTVSYRILVGAVSMLVFTDSIFTPQILRDTYSIGTWLDAGWLLAFGLFGIAALHPSMAETASSVRTSTRKRLPRFAPFAFAAMAGPIVAGIQQARGEYVAAPVILAGTTILVSLVAPRMTTLFHEVQDKVFELQAREETVRAEKERAETYFDSAAVLFLVLDVEGVVTKINDRACSALGYPKQEVIGRSWFDNFVPWRSREQSRNAFSELIASGLDGDSRAIETSILTADGGERLISWRLTLLRDREGRVIGTLSSGEDITEARASEESVKRTQERFRAMVQNTSDVISLVGADGSVRYVSPSIERILGYDPDELMDSIGFDFVHPDDLNDALRMISELVQTPQGTRAWMIRARHKDGSYRTLDVYAQNLLDDPAVGGILITQRDVTERLEMEERLRQSQKMEAIGQLAGGIAHDFNNLLSIIHNFTMFALENLEPGQRKDDLEQVVAASERGSNLVKQLLAFSRREFVRPTVLDLNEVVADTERLLHRTLGEHIQLTTELAEDLPRVEVDPGQLVQVMMNLAVNARDAMGGGGTLLIETGSRTVTPGEHARSLGLDPGRFVVLTVTDTGRGMTDQVRARIFEPFFTTKERGAGTGLGLATVYGIVQQAKGTITVRSEPQEGSIFQIYLPAVRRAPQPTRLPDRPQRSGSETILVAEDEPAVRELVARILRRRGYEVVATGTADEATEEFFTRNGSVDLVVTDLVMPGPSGLQLAARIRELNPRVPVIFMSGYSEKVALDQGMILVGEDVLSKPFTGDELVRRVREVLDEGSDLGQDSIQDVG